MTRICCCQTYLIHFITRLPSREHNDKQICVFSPTKLISSSLARCFNAFGRFGQHLIKLMSSTQGTVIMMQDYAERWKADLFLQPVVGMKRENQTAVTFYPLSNKKNKNKSSLDSLKTVYSTSPTQLRAGSIWCPNCFFLFK